MKRQPVQSEEMPAFIGIDYHKACGVFSVLDGQGDSLGQRRIDHVHPEDFHALVRRWPGCRVVFEVGMNWHWLFEILERELSPERIVLANPSRRTSLLRRKSRPIRWTRGFWPIWILADLLRARLISSVHVVGRESRQIKEVLRQRCFFVRQRTMLRNRIHRLLGGQQEVKLPQCSDLFGREGLSLLEKLELPPPTRLLLTQQLALLKERGVRIREDEETLEDCCKKVRRSITCAAYPVWDQSWLPWSSLRSTPSSASPQLRSFVATPTCILPPAGAEQTFQGKLLRHCNKWLRWKWLRWAFVEAAWVAIGCSGYFGDFYKRKRDKRLRQCTNYRP